MLMHPERTCHRMQRSWKLLRETFLLDLPFEICGQPDGKRGALAGLTLHLNGSLVPVHDPENPGARRKWQLHTPFGMPSTKGMSSFLTKKRKRKIR
jgi:hypothetical protein